METALIKIGNSKVLRLSKTILDKYNIKDKVELILEKEQIILKPIASARKNWEREFKKMSETGDDQLLMPDVFEKKIKTTLGLEGFFSFILLPISKKGRTPKHRNLKISLNLFGFILIVFIRKIKDSFLISNVFRSEVQKH